MVFCNPKGDNYIISVKDSHNPYFNRWFSAIKFKGHTITKAESHNPYFNRWFSAIKTTQRNQEAT